MVRSAICLRSSQTSCPSFESKVRTVLSAKLSPRCVIVILPTRVCFKSLLISFYCQNVDGLTMDTSLGSVLEHCPRLEALRLSGSLCSAETINQVIQGIKPAPGNPISLSVLGLGPVGAGVSWSDVSHALSLVTLDAGLQRVVIAEDVLRVIPADVRYLTLEKFTELRNTGLDVVFAKHQRVGDLF